MKLSLIKPLSAMLATFLMCMVFVASFSIEAFDTSKIKNHIQIINSDDIEKTKFIVNEKAFSWNDLNKDQQQSLRQFFKKVDGLEKRLSKTTDIIDAESLKMEAKVELLEKKLAMRLEKHYEKYGEQESLSEEIIEQLEDEISEIENNMPNINQSLIDEIEKHGNKIDDILIQISEKL